MFRNSEAIGQIGKWAAELNEYAVDFEHRSTIKSQVLADFIADWIPSAFDTTLQFEEPVWTVHCDAPWGASGIGIAAILTLPNGPKLRYAARLQCLTTNSIAEYEAVLLGLRKLRALDVRRCTIKSNSHVVIGHIEKTVVAKEPELVKYLMAVRRMEKHFAGFSLRHILRAKNTEADELAKAVAQNFTLPPDVFIQSLTIKAIKEEEDHLVALHTIYSEDWISPIFAFLSGSYKTLNKHEAKRMKARTRQYSIIGLDLYRRKIASTLLKCISRQ